MMYLSHLLINVGDNPDRPRPGRLWLRNVYHVHQRLSMAFPSTQYRAEDPLFLKPYDPANFERPHFLFRIDNAIDGGAPCAIILVQSEIKPDWEYAFQNARHILAAPPETRDYNPVFQNGQRLRFRIRMNLSKKIKKSKDGTDLTKKKNKQDEKGQSRVTVQGKRVALNWDKGENPDDVIRQWFSVKAARCGFHIRDFQVVQLGWVVGYKPKNDEEKTETEELECKANDKDKNRIKMPFRSALLEGILEVTETETFTTAIAKGIGAAKSFGFGLLSVKEL